MAESSLPKADELLRSAVSLLRQVSPRSLELKDQQTTIKRFASLATLAASATLQTGAVAKDALLFEARSDVEVLRDKRGNLAAAFGRLRDEIDAFIPEAAFGSKEIHGGLLTSQLLVLSSILEHRS